VFKIFGALSTLTEIYVTTGISPIEEQAIYLRTVIRQFSYIRRSYDIDTAPFAIHEKWRTYDWRKYERKSATYLPMSYDRHRWPFY